MVTIDPKVCALAAAAVLLGACATTDINPRAVTNPPPAERFASFGRFELKQVQLAPAYASDDANREATRIIQAQLDARLGALVNQWNDDGKNARNPRILAIEPRVEQVKFLSAAARFWTGALSGSSAVIMKVRYVDVATGRVVAEPEFYQHAAAMAGAWSLGAHDQDMLKRVADLVSEYTARNYTKAVGGPTGATPELVR
jgi:hypothetical protein